jgi:hypothetical protein
MSFPFSEGVPPEYRSTITYRAIRLKFQKETKSATK